MTTISVRKAIAMAGALAMASFAMAQDTSTAGGWRKVGDPPAQTQAPSDQPNSISQSNPNPAAYPETTYPEQQTAQPPYSSQQPNSPPQPNYSPQPNYPAQRNYPQSTPASPAYQQQGANYQVPPQVLVPAGTYLTVRVNQQLSSEHNQPGDAFSATLTKPLVANGVVLAEPGQTIGGRVAQAQRAGHVEGLSKLGVELTDLTLVDGQNVPLRTTLTGRVGSSTVGRDVAGVAGTTALGAAIGAAAGWGKGAAIGAGAGAAAGIIGVLATRGQPSVIYPEQVLTFRVEQPFTVFTERSPQAFRYVQPNEYNQPDYGQGPGYSASAYGPPEPAPYAPYYGGYGGYPGYGYGYPYYPYSGFSLFIGPSWGRGYYYGGRHYGGFSHRGHRR
jgi:hypothetical protein